MTATWKVGISPAEVAERIARTRASNEAGRSLAFALTLKGAPEHVFGQLGAHAVATGEAVIGYHMDPNSWGRGLATEALAAVIAMTELLTALPRLTAGVRVINPASRRVLEHCAFRQIGVEARPAPARDDAIEEVWQFERVMRRSHRAAGSRM